MHSTPGTLHYVFKDYLQKSMFMKIVDGRVVGTKNTAVGFFGQVPYFECKKKIFYYGKIRQFD